MNWAFVRRWAYVGATAVLFGIANRSIIDYYSSDAGSRLWLDSHIYYRATAAWLASENPWATTYLGVPFAAPPPALLLNIPLVPLGETAATAFWVVANSVALIYIFRKLRLPPYWLMFHPIVEGFMAATPDIALAGLALGGAGGLAALIKPYAVPGLIAGGSYRAVLLATVAVVLSAPVLPWSDFFASREVIMTAFRDHAVTISAWAIPVLIPITSIGLVMLPWRLGLALVNPGLLAQQPHYLVFALGTIARSRVLTWACAVPIEGLAAMGVIVYSIYVRSVAARVDALLLRRIRTGSRVGGLVDRLVAMTSSAGGRPN